MRSFNPSDRFIHDDIKTFVLEVTQQCNFRCKYCCFSGEYSDFRQHNETNMSTNILDKAIEYIIRNSSKEDMIDVSFYGGEALLRQMEIKYAVGRLRQHFLDRVMFNISTNGLLLTDTLVDWICTIPKIRISVSVDGNKIHHDKNRVTLQGAPTFDAVIGNLRRFKERYPQQYIERIQLLLTYASLLDVEEMNQDFDTLKSIMGQSTLHMARIEPNFENGNLYFDTIDTKRKFFDKAFFYYQQGIQNLYTIVFENLLRSVEKNLTDTAADKFQLHTCFDHMYSTFISATGQLRACEHCTESLVIGTIDHGVDSNKMRQVSNRYAMSRNMFCRECEVFAYCQCCIATLKDHYRYWPIRCQNIRENIRLALAYKKLIEINQ